ncbi:MAG: hypothetical protein L0J74_06435 [Corynebacterium sp.]|uniref:hypothetical protein n=1 Tax=Corynebacterium TaxID=1716 RepID=UPI0026470A0C|nr:hypothetical protein [Corynebacterium sp.]MDN5724030.1 hypothetical protein [Corynebacterium sp.]MDN6281920.1 hypothetical protein [Corynebacterium sp.]MDN6305431.1 hypothetical protein [Corynebacterium sp.]MDN6367666.1 hypothetical protein [Corynebacterium sp.]MDN6375455.1 hypothetical protein [Corynebacterium sp.]
MSEKLTVAELMARNAKEGGRSGSGRPRRRRTLEEGGVSVSELTGSIPVVRDEDLEHVGAHESQDAATEQVEAAEPTVQDAVAEPVEEPDVEVAAEAAADNGADTGAGTPAASGYPGLFSHDTDATTIIPVAGDADTYGDADVYGDAAASVAAEDTADTVDTGSAEPDAAGEVEAGNADADATNVFPTVGATAAGATAAGIGAGAAGIQTESADAEEEFEEFSGSAVNTADAVDTVDTADTVDSVDFGHDTDAYGTAEAGMADADAEFDADAEYTDSVDSEDPDEIIEYEDDAVSWPAMIGQAAIAVVIGVIIFFGFTLLWDKLAAGLVLAMAVIVTLICVGLVHALLRHRDTLILVLSLIVGLALTLGPRLILSI